MRETLRADTMPGVRLLIYNIRYATGTGPAFHLPVPGAGYLRSSRQVLSQITEFIKRQDPDVVGLIEVDTGSIRTGMVNQADFIARSLGHYSTFECKYGVSSVNQLVPIVRKQANAFLAAPRVRGERFHYFDTGIKRLIIELELDDVAIFLVHLSLKFRHRQYQLRYLYDLVRKTRKPVIVAGDFNTYWGDHEIYLFMQAAGLTQRQRARPSLLPEQQPAQGARFHPAQRADRGDSIRDSRHPTIGSPAADLRFHDPRTCAQGGLSRGGEEQLAAEIDADRIAWLTCDTPGASTNVLSASVLEDLAAALREHRRKAARRGGGVAPPSRTDSSPAPTSRNSCKCAPRRTATPWCAPARRCSISSRVCPAPPSPRCTASRWAEAWSSPSPAAIGSARTTASCPWGCRRCCSGFIPDSAAPCARCGSSACGRPWS